MPTTTPAARQLPNTIGPLAFAIVSAVALARAMSGTGNDVLDIVVLLTVLAAIAFSTRYTVRTLRRLSDHDFQLAHMPRWLMAAVALLINGLVCFLVAGSLILFLGVMITGKGVVG